MLLRHQLLLQHQSPVHVGSCISHLLHRTTTLNQCTRTTTTIHRSAHSHPSAATTSSSISSHPSSSLIYHRPSPSHARSFSTQTPTPPAASSPSDASPLSTNNNSSGTSSSSTASPATSSSSTSTSPIQSDGGAQFEFGDTSAEKPSTWRRNVALLATLIGIGYHIYSQRKSFVNDEINRYIVSCVASEIHDLINVFHFTTKDLESLYARTMQQYPRGALSIDDFAVLLAQQVNVVRTRRARERHNRDTAREKQQYDDDLEEVLLERKIERTQESLKRSPGNVSAEAILKECQAQLAALIEHNRDREQLRDKEAKADADEAHADEHKANAFVPIDTYTFYRTTPPKSVAHQAQRVGPSQQTNLIDVRDLFVGLSNLIFDHQDLTQKWTQMQGKKHIPSSLDDLHKSWSQRDIEVFTRSPETKLHFAFRVSDTDRDGWLSLAETEKLIERLIHTGHVIPESIVQRQLNEKTAHSTYFLPYVYEQRTMRQLTEDYWNEIATQRRKELMKQRESILAASPSTQPSSLPSLDTPSFSPDIKISWSEFLSASRYLTDSNSSLGFWYLHTTFPNGGGTGGFYRWRIRQAEGVRRRWNMIPMREAAKEIDHAIEAFQA